MPANNVHFPNLFENYVTTSYSDRGVFHSFWHPLTQCLMFNRDSEIFVE